MAWFPNWPEASLTLDNPQIVLCGKDHDEGSQKELPNQMVISGFAWAPLNESSINGNPLGHSWFCIPESKPSAMGWAALRNAKISLLEEVCSFVVWIHKAVKCSDQTTCHLRNFQLSSFEQARVLVPREKSHYQFIWTWERLWLFS